MDEAITTAEGYRKRKTDPVKMPSGAVFRLKKSPAMSQVAALNSIRKTLVKTKADIEQKGSEGAEVTKQLELAQIEMEEQSTSEICKIAHSLVVEPTGLDWDDLDGDDQIYLIGRVSDFITKMSNTVGGGPKEDTFLDKPGADELGN